MARPSSIRIALVQPHSAWGPREESNVQQSLDWLDQCSKAGARLVVFPEGYPGPTSPKNSFDALTVLRRRARELQLFVIAGNIEAAPGGGHYVCLHLIGEDGNIIGTYRRTTPRGPYVYHDIPMWRFDYKEASNALRIFDTSIGRIGMLVCSEVYAPELSRTLAVLGADIILFPAGGGQGDLIPTWQTVIAARAIENIVYTGASQNLYEPHERGLAMIAGPEGVLSTRSDSGMLISDLDLDRLEFLRTEDERIEVPRRYRTVPGLLRWRRPELYARILSERPETLVGEESKWKPQI
jgi:predicted amidohydrolase